MKTLILVRHAKSSWSEEGISDFDRPLNDRGKKDAPEMAERLKAKGLKIDAIVSSPAKRTQKTAQCFAKEFKIDKEDIVLEPYLYEAPVSDFLKVITTLKNSIDTAILFSHNNGITDFANTLTHVRTDNIPTCGIFAVQANVDNWKAFTDAEKQFLFYDYPKNPLAAI